VDLAFDSADHEKIEVFEDDNLKIKIENLCTKRNITDPLLIQRIFTVVVNQVNNA
jgi:hypothetical protein